MWEVSAEGVSYCVRRLGDMTLRKAIILLGDGGHHHPEILCLLVAADADVNPAHASGGTSLGDADCSGFASMLQILERAGARQPP